jgi:hypothetical protein
VEFIVFVISMWKKPHSTILLPNALRERLKVYLKARDQ